MVACDFTREVDVSRRIRNAFQSIGKRHEAREFYYRERCYERKALWSPYIQKREEFPKRKYVGRLTQLINHYRKGDFDRKKTIELLLDLIWFHVRIWVHPFYLTQIMREPVNIAFGSYFSSTPWPLFG